MIQHFGSLSKLFSATMQEFSAIHGLGSAKFAQLQAVLELAKRAISEDLKNHTSLSSPQSVKQYLQLFIGNKTYESFVVLFLDVKNCLITSEELFRGTLNHASVYPREIVKRALQHNAAAIIIAHNHPSGSPEPSQADLNLTRTLKQTLALVDIRVLDHFIVANPHVYSFAEHGDI
jgi:DNA repair protein RadC